MFTITERLRRALTIAQAQHEAARKASTRQGLKTEEYVLFGKSAEYHRGRVEALRFSIETVVGIEREEKAHRYRGVEV